MYSGIGRRTALRAALAAAGTTALGARSLAAAPATEHAERYWPSSLPAADAPAEYRTPGGHYFGQTGFAVVDAAGGPQFWAGMRHIGGVQVLGYPISRPYLAPDGLQYQAFQRGVLQWRPDVGAAWLANVMDWLHDAGHDDWLLSLGVPRQRNDDGSLTDFAQIKAARLRWLTSAPIKRYFMQAGAAHPSSIDSMERGIAVYGLPTSPPEKHGPFIAQRFQRGVLQYWTEAIPGLPLKGTVVGALAGDLARQAGIFPDSATAAAAPATPAVIGHVALSRSSIAQGQTLVVRLWAPLARRIAGTIGNNPLLLIQRGNWWVSIGGVERLAAVGSLPLRLVAEGSARGATRRPRAGRARRSVLRRLPTGATLDGPGPACPPNAGDDSARGRAFGGGDNPANAAAALVRRFPAAGERSHHLTLRCPALDQRRPTGYRA